jgi:hypothetical protein
MSQKANHSGSFLINSKGDVIGMVVSAVKSSALCGGDQIVFSQGCFIIMEDALRWTTKVLAEEVAIVPEPTPET